MYYFSDKWVIILGLLQNKNLDHCAFTLAEVLITLAIIGVVAALTIPTVIQNYRKTQTVTQLKKIYSALANTTNLAIAEYGPVTGWEIYSSSATAPDGTSGSEYFANKYLIPYLKVSKNCGTKTTGECRAEINYLDKSYSGIFGSSEAKFYLNDGTFISVTPYNYTGTYPCNKYANIYVDINGQKKPNVVGKDLFRFNYWICYPDSSSSNNGKFTPAGVPLTRDEALNSTPSGCNKSANGIFCAGVIMLDGWQIKDDYPWD